MGKLNKDNKKCYIMGDFNINLLDCKVDNAMQKFVDTLASQCFFPTITKPTKLTNDNR